MKCFSFSWSPGGTVYTPNKCFILLHIQAALITQINVNCYLPVLSSHPHINEARPINVEQLQTMDEIKFELIKDNKIKQSLHHIGTIADIYYRKSRMLQ